MALTYEGRVIASAREQEQAYDAACRRVLSLKEISARLLKATVEELKDFTIEEIKSFMGDMEITPVHVDTPSIILENNEDITITEGKCVYDVKFTLKIPDKISDEEIVYIWLIINIEAQNDFNPGYHILKRAVYYCGRLISSQYGTVFQKSDYTKLRKVYSIWVCTNPSPEYRNTIVKYSMKQEILEGKLKFKTVEDEEKERKFYDLIDIVLVCLDNSKRYDEQKIQNGGILELLSTIFNSQLEFPKMKIILENNYGIKMTEEVNKEVEQLCNLSTGVWKRGWDKGREDGWNEGRNEGEFNMCVKSFKILFSLGKNFDEIVKLHKMTPEEAKVMREYLEKNGYGNIMYKQ